MAIAPIILRNHMEGDLVKKNEILKAQVELEEKARRLWSKKWGFYLELDKICIEEAAKRGIAAEEFKKRVSTHMDTSKAREPVWDLKRNDSVPKTSSGFLGWRSRLEYSLERTGPLYVSPSHTLPEEPPLSHIILG